MKHIDFIRRSHTQRSTPTPTKPSGTGARFTAFAGKTQRRRVAREVIVAAAVSPVLFVLAMLSVIGMAVVVIYGIVALVVRLSSRTSFILALAALIYMIVLQLAAAEVIAQGMAVLAYILLTVGAISLAREVKMSRGLRFRKH